MLACRIYYRADVLLQIKLQSFVINTQKFYHKLGFAIAHSLLMLKIHVVLPKSEVKCTGIRVNKAVSGSNVSSFAEDADATHDFIVIVNHALMSARENIVHKLKATPFQKRDNEL